MKKYPFSKKAVSFMLATALVVTPLASVVPVGGSFSTVEASTLPPGTVENLLELQTYYDGLTDPQKIIIDDHRGLLRDLNSNDWSIILGDLEDVIDQKLNSSNTATGMMIDLAEVFLQTNYTDVLNEVISFHGQYNSDFNNAFGVSFVEFLSFYADMVNNMKDSYNTSTIEAAIGSSLTDFMVDEAKNVDNYSSLSSAVKSVIGEEYTIASLVEIKFTLMDQLSSKGSANYEPGILKNTLIAALMNNLDAPPVVTPPTSPTPTPTPTPDPTPDPEPSEAVEIGEDSTTTEDTENGKRVTVDTEKLTESIKNVENLDRVRITVETAKGEVAEVRVPVQAFTAVSERNPNAKVEVATKEGSYRLPVKEVNVENLAKELGVEATDDVSISVQISEVEDSSDSITKGNLKSVSPIMEFKVVASSGDKSVEMRRFSSFVERELVGENDFNPKNSTAVQLMDDGTFRSVPTIFNGNRAVFRSLTNSRYTVVENDKTFTDIEPVRDWAGEQIEKLASKYIIQGFNENEFKPMGDTTRGQLVALLTRSLGLTTDSEYGEQFGDVKATHTFAPELTAALEAGIIEGYTDGTFKPDVVVSREQAAAMIARALRHIGFDESQLADKDLSFFVDEASVNDRFKDDVELLLQSGIMVGGTDQNFRPENINSRGQTAVVLDNFLKFIKFIN